MSLARTFGMRGRAIDGLAVLVAALDVLLSVRPSWDVSFLLSAMACLALPLRRRLPWVVLLATVAGLLTGYSVIAAMIAVYELAAADRPRRELGGAVALVALAYVLPWPPTELPRERLHELALDLIYGVLVGGGPAALGLLVRTRQLLNERLADLARSQAEEKRLHAAQVLGRDRARLAREMHDLVSHQVMLISVHAGAMTVTSKDDAAVKSAALIQELSGNTLRELRHMVGMLRDSGDIAIAPGTLLADIRRLAEDSGARLHLDVGDEMPREAVQHAAYRIVQEALTNAAKHAPGAATTILVARKCDTIVVEVRNTAPGEPVTAAPTGGYGLRGLRERAEELGGTLDAGPSGDGFTVRALLPDLA